jgi:hypothetical protein
MDAKLSPAVASIRAVVLTFAVTGFLAALASAQGQTSTNLPSIPHGFATRADYLKSLTKEKNILDAYHAGQISKDEAALALSALGNGKSMDTYGKVVDQDGEPVVGAKVRAALERETSLTDDKEYDTKTDAKRLFHFLGLHGSALDIIPEKAGYDFDPKLPCSSRPDLYVPDPTNPLIVTMWKLHGAEPMVHSDTKGLPYWYSFLEPNGSWAWINMMTCRDAKYEKNASGERHYDLEVRLYRDELIKTNANRVLFCNWSATIGITNGGIVEIPTNNIYPFEAPVEGYQPSITLNFTTNMVGWSDQFKKEFYFESQNGKIYGRMTIEMDNWGRFRADIYTNPAGSRNLEFDPKEQIDANGRKLYN